MTAFSAAFSALPLQSSRDSGRRMVLALPVVFVGVLAVMALDAPIARLCDYYEIRHWIDDYRYSPLGWYVGRAMRQPGEAWLMITSATFLLIFHPQTWRAGGFMLLAFLPGAINSLLKWVAGRHRPRTGHEPWDWNFFENGIWGLFNQKNLTFASGHTTLAFAWATGMAIAYPRFRRVFYALAALCGVQRVLSADHYLTDVLVGAALGVVTVRLMFRILSRIVPPATDRPARTPDALQSGTRTNDRPQPRDSLPDRRPGDLPVAGHPLL
jgi:membrane-associated phospholipid phosphatase